jgi:hypothetical protein
MTNKQWADLIREHYDEIRDEIVKLEWDGYGRVQHDVLIDENGNVHVRANIGGNDYNTGMYTVWSTRGMEYATPYDYWDESDWIGAVREIVGAECMPAFWKRVAHRQGAEDARDYMEFAGTYYDHVSVILQKDAAFDNIMTTIAANWKQDTESDRIQDAENAIDRVLEELSE